MFSFQLCDSIVDCLVNKDDEHINICEQDCPLECVCRNGMIFCHGLNILPPIPRVFHGLTFTSVKSFRRSLYILSEHFNVYLNLSGNNLTSLYIEELMLISNYILLQVLDLSNNAIDQVNTYMFYLPNLKVLFMRNNALLYFADDLQLEGTDLWHLDITKNIMKVHRGFRFGRKIGIIRSDYNNKCCHPFSSKECKDMNCLNLITQGSVHYVSWVIAVINLVFICCSFTISLINESNNDDTNLVAIFKMSTSIKFWTAPQTQNVLSSISSLLFLFVLVCTEVSYGDTFIEQATAWYLSSTCHVLGSLVIISYFSPLLMALTRNCMTCVRLHKMRHNLAWHLDSRKDLVALSLVWTVVLLTAILNSTLSQTYDEYCVVIDPWPCSRELGIQEYILFLLLSPLNIIIFLIKVICFVMFTRATRIAASRDTLTKIEELSYIRLALDVVPEVLTRLSLTILCIVGMMDIEGCVPPVWFAVVILPVHHILTAIPSIIVFIYGNLKNRHM